MLALTTGDLQPPALIINLPNNIIREWEKMIMSSMLPNDEIVIETALKVHIFVNKVQINQSNFAFF